MESTIRPARNPLMVIGSFLAATAIAGTGLVLGASAPAHAVEVPVQRSNEKLAYLYPDGDEELVDLTGGNVDVPMGRWLKFSTDWSIDGVVNNGDTFDIVLPDIFNPLQDLGFPLKNTEGHTLATCQYTTSAPYSATCTFAGAPESGYLDPSGDLFIQLTSIATSERTDIEFEIGGNPIVIPDVGIGPPGMGHGTLRKRGTMSTYLDENGSATARGWWELMFLDGGTVTITDQLTSTAPNRPHTLLGGYELARYDITDVLDDGAVEFDPATKTLISDISAPTVAEDNRSFTVDLPTLDGYLYVYGYFTHADGEVVEGKVFHNTATVNDEIVEYGTEAEARAGGSADATVSSEISVARDACPGDLRDRHPRFGEPSAACCSSGPSVPRGAAKMSPSPFHSLRARAGNPPAAA